MNSPFVALCTGLMLITLTAVAQEDRIETVANVLAGYRPIKVTLGEQLRIVLPVVVVDPDIYRVLMLGGLCSSAYEGSGVLDGVRSIRITNADRDQGWLFNGGKRECIRLLNAPILEAREQLFRDSQEF